MKLRYLLKGAAVTVVVLVVSMVIHVVCNMKGIQLDTVVTGTTSAVGAMLIYHGLIKNEINEGGNKNGTC